MIRRMWFPFVAITLSFLLRAWDPVVLQAFRNDIFDSYQRISPRQYTPVPVLVVDIDDASIESLGQWPWPRFVFANMVDRLTELGAVSISFDVMFSEPDRTSPSQVSKLWPKSKAMEDAAKTIGSLPDHDELLAAAMAASNVVIGTALTRSKEGRDPAAKAGFAYGGTDPARFAPNFPGVVANLEVLEQAASGNGSLSIAPEIDGTVRRVPLVFANRGKLFPSLIAEALRTAQGAKTIIVKSSDASGSGNFGDATGITSIKIGAFEIPTTNDGAIMMHFTRPAPDRVLPAMKIFEPDIDPTLIEGKIVIIGSSAAGLKDLRATPLNAFEAGVNIHADALEQIILGEFLLRPDWASGAEIVFLLIFGLLLIVSLQKFGIRLSAAVVFFFVSCLVSASWLAFVNYQWLVDPIYISITAVLIFLAHSFQIYLESETEKREVRHAFAHYLSPELVEQLAENPDKLSLGGEQKDLTILFADIVGFTTLSEKFAPAELTEFMNQYLTPMTEIILDTGGTIDKYIGDAIMAFWNAPLDDVEHAKHGCLAGLTMQSELQVLNLIMDEQAKANGKTHYPIKIGVGLNSGEACVGNLGSDQRFDYSVLGDTVNIASRLEGQTRPYGFGIIVGEETRQQVPDFAMLEIDLIRVKGKTKPLRIFALFGSEDVAGLSIFARKETMQNNALRLYRAQNWSAAADALRALKQEFPSEFTGYTDLMLGRIESFVANPPPPDWDGVFIATTK
jgi:adenylate cyclase